MAPFEHQHAAHCESGVVSKLSTHAGFKLSEPMAFGVSGAMTFAYLPFIKMTGMPLIAYRMLPGTIIKGVQKRLGISFIQERFSTMEAGEEQLDRILQEGGITGAQAGIFWLPYFPPQMRFHFNAHNLIVYGEESGEYLISDPVFDYPTRIKKSDLTKARFVKGLFAPKGILYRAHPPQKEPDWPKVLSKAIRSTARSMLYTPIPFTGIRGMKMLARRIDRLDRDDPRFAKLFAGHVVRMQEEIGTGGGGFRFIYAAFLQEAAQYCSDNETLLQASEEMTAAGDRWRAFALLCAKACKGSAPFEPIAQALREAADQEAQVYQKLKNFKAT
jgi:hypothetical protein